MGLAARAGHVFRGSAFLVNLTAPPNFRLARDPGSKRIKSCRVPVTGRKRWRTHSWFLWNYSPVTGHRDLHLRQTLLTQSQTHDTIGNPAKANAISSAG